MKILGVIPARGGSKSVNKKNIAEIAGFPLIYYTINEAKKISLFTDLIVSTDDKEIANISKKYGAKVPFMRPLEIAQDDTLSIDVLKHSLFEMEKIKNTEYDAVMMLQPTSPFRNEKHIDESIKIFKETNADSVVSVVSVEGYHPFRMKRMIGHSLINYIDQGFEDMRPRQVLPKVFIRNGAIYLSKSNVIKTTDGRFSEVAKRIAKDYEN